MNNLKIGDVVYFIDTYRHIWKGIISKTFHSNTSDKEYAHITNAKSPYDDTTYGSCNICIDNIFETLKDAQDANKKYSDRIQDEYRDKIKSVEDLVKIMFSNPCGGTEDIDWELREVVIEKAKELLNLNLEEDN